MHDPTQNPQQIRMLFVEGPEGFLAFVDNSDYERLAHYRWIGVRAGRGLLYARASLPGLGRVYLHRAIAEARPGEVIDHGNCCAWDCTQANLRAGSHAQNIQNAAGRPASRRSRFKGVSPGVGRLAGQWRAQIKVGGRQRHLGHYKSEEDAALAYNRAAAEAFGEHAFLNPITTC